MRKTYLAFTCNLYPRRIILQTIANHKLENPTIFKSNKTLGAHNQIHTPNKPPRQSTPKSIAPKSIPSTARTENENEHALRIPARAFPNSRRTCAAPI